MSQRVRSRSRRRLPPRMFVVPRRRRYSIPRRYRRFRRKSHAIPVLPVLTGVVAPMLIAVQKSNFLTDVQTDPMKASTGLIDQICQRYTGLSPLYGNPFNAGFLFETYGGLAAGIFGHMLANKFGVNKSMKKIPFLGKYVEL